jgi:hypothetical protein
VLNTNRGKRRNGSIQSKPSTRLAALYKPLAISATSAAAISQKTQIGIDQLSGVLTAGVTRAEKTLSQRFLAEKRPAYYGRSGNYLVASGKLVSTPQFPQFIRRTNCFQWKNGVLNQGQGNPRKFKLISGFH